MCVRVCFPRENRGVVVTVLSDAAAYASDASTQRMKWEIMREEEGGKDKLDEEMKRKIYTFFNWVMFVDIRCLCT